MRRIPTNFSLDLHSTMARTIEHDIVAPSDSGTEKLSVNAVFLEPDTRLTLNPAQKSLAATELLCEEYKCPIPYFHELDPLSELISSLLSHRTRNADSGRAFKTLRARFADWSAVADAPVEEIEDAISACTWPEQKAPRIQSILREIAERRGADMSLDFLGQMSVPDARAWLETLSGVGPKTSAATLIFSRLRMPALPVDSHHHRVAARIGLIPPTMAVGPSHAALEALMPSDYDAQKVYDLHEVFMLHGQRCCFFRGPACRRCPLLTMCSYGQDQLNAALDKP